MRNIELKARCPDLARAEAVCRRLGAELQWTRRQTDVYFRVPDGRLKLRTESPGEAVLVSYHRPDVAAARDSLYEVTPVANANETLASLAEQHGILARVEKTRTLYLLDNVRIHLDSVDGLGTFIEFEAVMGPGHDDGEAQALIERLRRELGIAEDDLLSGSYGDMMPG
jgi:predicted adenylyl cyclase CyaB